MGVARSVIMSLDLPYMLQGRTTLDLAPVNSEMRVMSGQRSHVSWPSTSSSARKAQGSYL